MSVNRNVTVPVGGHQHRDGHEARREHHGVVEGVRARYLQETLHNHGELGAGQLPQRPFEEEQYGHQEPRKESGTDDGDGDEDVDDGHGASPFFRLLVIFVSTSVCHTPKFSRACLTHHVSHSVRRGRGRWGRRP